MKTPIAVTITEKVIDRKADLRSKRAVIHRVDGIRVDIKLYNTGAIIKNVRVIGNADSLSIGDEVSIDWWDDGRPVVTAPTGIDAGASGTVSLAYEITTDDHGALSGLADYDHTWAVHKITPGTITAAHTFAPPSPAAPFVLSSNAQGQLVIGLRADQLNKSITAGDGLTGGGLLTSTRTVTLGTPSTLTGDTSNGVTADSHTHDITTGTPAADSVNIAASTPGSASTLVRSDHTHNLDESIIPAWTGKHTWSGVDLQVDDGGGNYLAYADISEMSVYINAASIPPSDRGALTVKSATTSQRTFVIQQIAGQLDAAKLLTVFDSTGDDLILLTNIGDLESGQPGFVSGEVGWQITHDGHAEFLNVTVRGELHASIFVADEITAAGGQIMVMSGFKVAPPQNGSDNILPAVDSSFTLVVDASWDTAASYIQDDDVLRLKFMGDDGGTGLDLWDIYLEVNGTPISNGDRDLSEGLPGTFDVICFRRQGGTTGIEIYAGTSGVVWGTVGGAADTYTGGIMLKGKESASEVNSPYISVFTINADGDVGYEPWEDDAWKSRVRMGNLDGVLGLDEQWGIAVSSDLSNSALPHVILSDEQLTLKGVHQYWWDNSYNLRGEVDPDATGASALFWLGTSATDKKLEVLADGTLKIHADIAVGAGTSYILNDVILHLPFEGARPFNTDFSINTSSSYGQRPSAESGSIVGRPGNFGKAIQFSGARTNNIIDPSGEGSSWGVNQSATVTESDSGPPDGAWVGSGCIKVVTAATTDNSGAKLTTIDLTLSTACVLQFRVWVSSGTTIEYRLTDDSLNVITQDQVAGTGAWQGVYDTFTSDNTDTNHELYIWTYGDADPSFTFWIDGIQIEEAAYHTPFLYGDMPEHSWSGTDHISESTRDTSPILEYDINESLNGRVGTISCWIYIEGISGTSSYLFMGSDASNEFDVYYSTSGNAYFRYNGSGAACFFGALAERTWYNITCTWDYGAGQIKAYLNGDLEDTETVSGEPTWATDLTIGMSSAGGATLNGFMEDFISIGRVLTADEIRAIYISNSRVTSTQSGFEILLTGTDRGKVWGHAGGLFGLTADSTACFGLLTETKTWGGFTDAGEGDVILGHNKASSSAIHWSKDDGTFGFYGGGSGTVQVEINTDGSLLAGGGTVILDEDGIKVCDDDLWGEILGFYKADGTTLLGSIGAGVTVDPYDMVWIECGSISTSTHGALAIRMHYEGSSLNPTLYGYGDLQTFQFHDADVRVEYGLYVGGVSTNPATGTITATQTITAEDYMVALGGLHVGGASDPDTDNLWVDGYSYILGGLHIGGTSDPVDDNLLVDGATTTKGMVFPSETIDVGSGGGLDTGGRTFVFVASYVNDAADNLDAMTAGTNGQIVILKARYATEPITVRDVSVSGAGNIRTAGAASFTLHRTTTGSEIMMLIYETGNDAWQEVSRSDN